MLASSVPDRFKARLLPARGWNRQELDEKEEDLIVIAAIAATAELF